jgi:hypothetical protein
MNYAKGDVHLIAEKPANYFLWKLFYNNIRKSNIIGPAGNQTGALPSFDV